MHDTIPGLPETVFDEINGFLVCTGAGFSADSNIPVYVGKNGKWDLVNSHSEFRSVRTSPNLDLLDSDGLFLEEIQEFGRMNEKGEPLFLEKPEKFWNYFSRMVKNINENEPHKGYYGLLEMIKNNTYYVVTSNIDGYHSRAGYQNVIECHGRLVNSNKSVNVQCTQCDPGDIWGTTDSLPMCKKCNSCARPNYLSLNDYYCNIAPYTFDNKIRSEMIKWLSHVEKNNIKIVIFEIGVGDTIKTVKNRARDTWKRCKNSILIRINPLPDPDPLPERYYNIAELAVNVF